METCDERRKRPKQKFSQTWLNDDRYKFWIREVPSDNTLFYCSICNKTFSCSSHVSRHADSACHKSNIKENICDKMTDLAEKVLLQTRLMKKKKKYINIQLEKKFNLYFYF